MYAPYFAECPIESNLPSPHQMTSPFRFSSFTRLVRYLSQWVKIAGNRNLLWCTKYVRALYIQIPRCLSTRSTLLTDAPAMRMAKLSNIFPAGYLPSTKGWDLDMKALGPQFPQHCVTVTIVPFFCIETFGPSPLHLKQISENRARSCV